MKKTNMLLSFAVAGLFVVSAHADSKKMAPKMSEVKTLTTESACTGAGNTWNMKKNSCWTKEVASTTTTTTSPSSTTTTTTTPSSTTPASNQ